MNQIQFPTNCDIVSLSDIAQEGNDRFTDGPFGSRLKVSDYTSSGVQLIRLQNVGEGVFYNKMTKFTSEKKYEELIRHSIIPGDIIIAKMADPVARACILPKLPGKFLIVADCVKLRADEKKIIPKYLMYIINSPQVRKQAIEKSKGMTRLRINLSDIKKLKIPLPSLDTQRKTVKQLDYIFAQFEEKKKIIIQLTELKLRSLFYKNHNRFMETKKLPNLMIAYRNSIIHHALEGKYTNQIQINWKKTEDMLKTFSGTSQNKNIVKQRTKHELIVERFHEAYTLPKDWRWMKIYQICELISGQHILRINYNEEGTGLPYLTGPEDFGDKFPVISKWTDKPKSIAQHNDVLITVKGAGVGKINLLHLDNVAISRQLMAIRPCVINPEFLYLFLQKEFQNLQKLADWTTIPGIGRESILNLEVPFAPLEVQEIIVVKVNEKLKEINEMRQKLISIITLNQQVKNYMEHLQGTILSYAFSGKLVN